MKIKTANLFSFAIVGLCIINIAIRIPFLMNIPTNDSNVYFDGVLSVLTNHLNPFIQFVSYKPPFMFELTAIAFHIFGPSIIVCNLIIAIFSSITLLYTYLLGELLFSKKVGFFASLCLFFFPLFMAQSFQFTDAMFITPLTLATIYYYYRSNKVGYLIFGTFAALSRETGIFIPIFFGLMELYKELHKHKQKKDISLHNTILYLLPIVPFILWIFINKHLFGWFLDPTNIQFFNFGQSITSRILYVLRRAIIDTGMVITAPIFLLVCFAICTKRLMLPKKIQHMIITVLFLGITNVVFYSIGPFHPRYMLLLYPYFWILSIGMLSIVCKRWLTNLVIFSICLILIAFQYTLYFSTAMRDWGETDLSIFHIQALYEKTIRILEQQYIDPILIVGPRIYEWRDPYLGYRDRRANLLHAWRVDIPDNQAYGDFIHYTFDHPNAPVFFILQSDADQLPKPLQNKAKFIDRIYDESQNTKNYLTIYQIAK